MLRKKKLTPREVLMLATSDNDLPDLVVAPYLIPSVRRRLTEAGISQILVESEKEGTVAVS